MSAPGGQSIRGIFAPTITAYREDGSISCEATRRFVRFLLDDGVDGLTPLGSAGEPFAMNTSERKELLEAIVEETDGAVPIFAGTGAYGTAETIELSLHAKSIGCTGLMLITPYILRPPKKNVLDHFRRVRDRVGLPIMIYNVPVLTGVEITPEEMARLIEEDVIHAVKWSHVEVSRIHDTRLICGPEFPIFAGIDVIAFEALAVGADGWISGIPMIAPKLAVRLHRQICYEQDLAGARELWYRLLPLIQIEYRALGSDGGDPHWLAVCRESALLRGIPVGHPRPPLTSLSSEVRDELRSAMLAVGELCADEIPIA
jgi:4-hydroxy-tetrahydrodipicolinate synthase